MSKVLNTPFGKLLIKVNGKEQEYNYSESSKSYEGKSEMVYSINYDLSKAIVSVLEDCYSNSYTKQDIMKNELIQKFFINPINYDEIMSNLGNRYFLKVLTLI